MKIKRILASVLAVAMTCAMAGCGNSNDSSSSSASTSSGASSAAENSSAAESSSAAEEQNSESGNVFPENEFKTTTDGSAKVTVDGTKFKVGGKELWINGVNSSWDQWNDFGGAFNFEFWDEHFQKLHNSGCNASRIWINCNGDVGLELNEDGSFKAATTAHWEDLDDLFMLAEQYQIYLMPTVMSFDFFKDEQQQTNSYETWRELIQDNDKIDSFVDNYIIPLVERYGDSDYFWAVDLCNEPDWVVENGECGTIDWKYLQSYFARASAAIHEHSDKLVTVGMAMIKYNSDDVQGNYISDKALQEILGDDSKYDKSKAYVDFYSTHWYPWEEANWGVNYDKSPAEFKQDATKPCMIAELPAVTTDKEGWDLASVYEQAYKNGWQGMMAWKASGSDDGCGTWYDCKPAIEKMMEICPEKIFPLGKK